MPRQLTIEFNAQAAQKKNKVYNIFICTICSKDVCNNCLLGNFFKEWATSVWIKKKIYWAIIPHIFDQATDLGAILAYYQAWKEDKGDQSFKPFWFFFFGLFIIIFQRIISTITIYVMTHNYKAALLQFLDILMVKAVWVNYQLGLKTPCNPQRYIQLLVRFITNNNHYNAYLHTFHRKQYSSLHHKLFCQWDLL